MKIIGFNFTKISAMRNSESSSNNVVVNINFVDVQKDKFEFLKESEVFKVNFNYKVSYQSEKSSTSSSEAELLFEGIILISVDKDESKDLTKSWKDKELPLNIRTHLFNLILKRCSIKSLALEDDLNLTPHIPLPKINPIIPTKSKK